MPQLPYKWPPVTQLVAVVCIFVFMAIILFPVFQKTESYRHLPCITNMKRLGLAYSQYEQNDGDIFPAGIGTAGDGWAGQLYPYIKETGVYRCPDDAHAGPFISYAENRNLAKRQVKTLANPAATIALYEFSTLNCDPSTPEAVSATGTSAPQDSARHDDGAPGTHYALNFLLTDGHVQRLLPAQVSSGPGAVSPRTLPLGKTIRTFAVK